FSRTPFGGRGTISQEAALPVSRRYAPQLAHRAQWTAPPVGSPSAVRPLQRSVGNSAKDRLPQEGHNSGVTDSSPDDYTSTNSSESGTPNSRRGLPGR